MSIQFVYLILFALPLLSSIVFLYFKPQKLRYLEVLLAFSGAFLFTVCVMELLPELYVSKASSVGLFILIGFLLQLILDFFSHGVEHGHIHLNENSLLTFPYAIFISLCLHSLFEGMALTNSNSTATYQFFTASQNSILIGIIIHKIPITLILTMLLLQAKVKRNILFASIIVFCCCSPLGLFLSNYFEQNTFSKILDFNVFLALSIGIFLHISTTLLVESGKAHKFNFKNFIAVILGLFLAYLSVF